MAGFHAKNSNKKNRSTCIGIIDSLRPAACNNSKHTSSHNHPHIHPHTHRAAYYDELKNYSSAPPNKQTHTRRFYLSTPPPRKPRIRHVLTYATRVINTQLRYKYTYTHPVVLCALRARACTRNCANIQVNNQCLSHTRGVKCKQLCFSYLRWWIYTICNIISSLSLSYTLIAHYFQRLNKIFAVQS